MRTFHTRENILEKIRAALNGSVIQSEPDERYPVFKIAEGDLCEQFAAEFRALQGEVSFCSDGPELVAALALLVSEKGWRNMGCLSGSLIASLQLDKLSFINAGGEFDAGITGCEYLVARTGTVVMSSGQPGGRAFSVYTPVHIIIAGKSQILPDLQDVFNACEEKFGDEWPSALFFASGPSRTGDIEKKLVLGVHGPVEVYVFILEDDFDNGN